MRYPLLDKVKGSDLSQASQSDKFPEKKEGFEDLSLHFSFILFSRVTTHTKSKSTHSASTNSAAHAQKNN